MIISFNHSFTERRVPLLTFLTSADYSARCRSPSVCRLDDDAGLGGRPCRCVEYGARRARSVGVKVRRARNVGVGVRRARSVGDRATRRVRSDEYCGRW